MSKLPTCGHWIPGEDGPVLTPVPGCRACRDATPPPKRPRCVACRRPIDTSRHHVVLSTSVQVIDAGGRHTITERILGIWHRPCSREWHRLEDSG